MADPHKPRILLLSAYDAGSHCRWREQLVASQPDFEWTVLSLPPRFFSWRIRGNALTWLFQPELQHRYDLLIATSMVDLASIRGLHPNLSRIPSLLYMHENQFAYPDSGKQHSSAEPKMVNLYSAIAADRILFNSDWNRVSFLEGARRFLDKMPDGLPDGLLDSLDEKSSILPVPIEDRLFAAGSRERLPACPHLVWNHRWEYDKGPDRLLALLDRLDDRGQPFQLSVVGEQFRRSPKAFEHINERYGERIQHWGYLSDRAVYDELLRQADVVISTALHDYQGLSVLEAMASGCLALAPDRLAYPEYVPEQQRYASHVNDQAREAESAADTLVEILRTSPKQALPEPWRLSNLRQRYRQEIQALLI